MELHGQVRNFGLDPNLERKKYLDSLEKEKQNQKPFIKKIKMTMIRFLLCQNQKKNQ